MNMFDKYLIRMTVTRRILTNIEIDPMKIIQKRNITLGTNSKESAFYLLNLEGLYYLVTKQAYIVGGITILCSFIALQFVRKADELQDKKKDIEHKIFIVLLIASSVTVFDILKKLFDAFL